MQIRQLCKLDKVSLNHTTQDREISWNEVPQESSQGQRNFTERITRHFALVTQTVLYEFMTQRDGTVLPLWPGSLQTRGPALPLPLHQMLGKVG